MHEYLWFGRNYYNNKPIRFTSSTYYSCENHRREMSSTIFAVAWQELKITLYIWITEISSHLVCIRCMPKLYLHYFFRNWVSNSIMMLMKFLDLSQSDRSNWVMWQVKDPCPRPGWDGCLTREEMAFIKSIKTWIILLYIWFASLK